jgi:hypothetical protein
MKPKPIMRSGYVVASFDRTTRFLCRDKKHGHHVVTLVAASALVFDEEPEATEALATYRRLQGANYHGAWAVYRMNSKMTFEEMRAVTR